MNHTTDSARLSHVDAGGEAHMVDVGHKPVTPRVAIAQARVQLGAAALAALQSATLAKGDVLGTARIAGILAAKRCAELIPLCHSLPLSFVGIEFRIDAADRAVLIEATCRTDYRTGVEMEAMTAASIAALTLYDMCKAVDKGITLNAVRLVYKSGGKSGIWQDADSSLLQPIPGAEATSASPSAPVGTMSAAAAAAETAPCRDSSPSALAPTRVTVASPATRTTAPPVLTLLYFAQVAELVGHRSEQLAGLVPLSGAQLLQWLEERYPRLAPSSRLQLAVNQQHVAPSVILQAGDEVAVFEPVTGG